MKLIAITGGIGSGKSVVSRVLAAMGYPVYDCDSRARSIVDGNAEAKARICAEVCADAVRADGTLDRKKVADVVFADASALARLNAIVHRMVIADIKAWALMNADSDKAFVETAILYQSGLDRLVDEVWQVESPLDLRVARVIERDSMDACDVEARIKSQAFSPEKEHPCVKTIINDERESILMQLDALI